MAKTYTCARCGGEFDFARPDEEAVAEYRRDYPELAAADVPSAIVCDPCYQEFKAWEDGLSHEETAALDAEALLEIVPPLSVRADGDKP